MCRQMQVIEANNAYYIHTSTNVIIMLRWCSEMIMVLLINILNRTVNTCIIRTLSTKLALLVTKPYTYHAPPAHKICSTQSL